MIDHLNKVHGIPRGLHLKNIIKHAQKTFVFVKEKRLNRIKKDNKKVLLDKNRLLAIKKRLAKIHFSREYPCIEIICEERFEHKTQLEKHMRTNHKCEHCNITCDNVTNLTIHIEKDTFVHCLEFYLKKRQKREDERKENMKDNV